MRILAQVNKNFNPLSRPNHRYSSIKNNISPHIRQSHSHSHSQRHTPDTMTSSQITQLKAYNACDISDALLKLHVPNSGFLSDLVLRSPYPISPNNSRDPGIVIAPASTVRFVSKSWSVVAAKAGDGG
ncbi:hypothetical protein HYFRA_00006030, partial [Hymenoscyphus fraxineus]